MYFAEKADNLIAHCKITINLFTLRMITIMTKIKSTMQL